MTAKARRKGAAPVNAASAAGFRGFPRELAGFLRGLADNNSKTWFDANRAAYEKFYVEPAIAFAEAIEPGLIRI